MTDLQARILDCLRSSRLPLAANDIGHRLDVPVADVLIAVHGLTRDGVVVSKIRGPKHRSYYEVVDV